MYQSLVEVFFFAVVEVFLVQKGEFGFGFGRF